MLLFVVLFSAACGGKIENAVNWEVEKFEHIDQNGHPFSKDDLRGKVWVANFIFTNCQTVCPPMTANMARLQRMLKEEGLDDVHLVSFSVDPEVDTPEKLADYAFRFTEDFSNWHFLTGYAQKYIEQFAEKNFHLFVHKPEGEEQVNHGTDFFLVNQEGNIVKYYSGLDVPYEEIVHDVKILLN